MALAIELQLPKKKEEIYCDWMMMNEGEEKKVLLSYIGRDYINNLIAKIKKADLKIVAIKNHSLSIARSLKQLKDEVFLIAKKGLNITSFTVIQNNQLILSQSALNKRLNLPKEITKIINYQDWLNTPVKKFILLGNFKAEETKKLPLKITDLEFSEELKTAIIRRGAIINFIFFIIFIRYISYILTKTAFSIKQKNRL